MCRRMALFADAEHVRKCVCQWARSVSPQSRRVEIAWTRLILAGVYKNDAKL